MREPFVYDPNEDLGLRTRCQIYLGRHEETKLYTRGIISWFYSEYLRLRWLEKPADREIVRGLKCYISTSNPWTDNPNEAECWSGYLIDQFQKFLPEIEWCKSTMTAVQLDND